MSGTVSVLAPLQIVPTTVRLLVMVPRSNVGRIVCTASVRISMTA